MDNIYHSTYYGFLIFRHRFSGYWNTRGPDGRLMADTLQGLKALLRKALGK